MATVIDLRTRHLAEPHPKGFAGWLAILNAKTDGDLENLFEDYLSRAAQRNILGGAGPIDSGLVIEEAGCPDHDAALLTAVAVRLTERPDDPALQNLRGAFENNYETFEVLRRRAVQKIVSADRLHGLFGDFNDRQRLILREFRLRSASQPAIAPPRPRSNVLAFPQQS